MVPYTELNLPAPMAYAMETTGAPFILRLSVDIGAHVWWRIDLAWKLWQALYTLTSFTITGVVLAWFVRPKPA